MNRQQVPVLTVCLAILLSTYGRATAQDTHTLRLKIDDAGSRIDAASSRLSEEDQARLSARLDELRRQLTEFESLDNELDSRQQEIDDARFRLQHRKRSQQIEETQLDLDSEELAGLRHAYERDAEEHEQKRIQHEASRPGNSREEIEEYNRRAEWGSRYAETLTKRAEALNQRLEELFTRIKEQQERAQELQFSAANLKELISRHEQSTTSLETSISEAVGHADILVAAIPTRGRDSNQSRPSADKYRRATRGITVPPSPVIDSHSIQVESTEWPQALRPVINLTPEWAKDATELFRSAMQQSFREAKDVTIDKLAAALPVVNTVHSLKSDASDFLNALSPEVESRMEQNGRFLSAAANVNAYGGSESASVLERRIDRSSEGQKNRFDLISIEAINEKLKAVLGSPLVIRPDDASVKSADAE